jgi:hypothetical protein
VKRNIVVNVLLMCLMTSLLFAQKNIESSEKTHSKHPFLATNSVIGVVYVGSMTALYQSWYRDYAFKRFHFFNDMPEWKGMDKLGHATTSWWAAQWLYTSQLSLGLESENLALRSTIIPLCFMTTIEVFDGFSSGWGFSLGDMAANIAGAGLFYTQQHFFNQQRILLKYSYHQTYFAEQRPDLLGKSKVERMLKDYNGQTYWLTIPIKRNGWFCLSMGYNASGMLGGSDNIWTNQGVLHDFSSVERFSTLSMSFDIDLLKLPIKGKFWKTFASTFRWIKIPAPTIQWSKSNNFKLLPYYY